MYFVLDGLFGKTFLLKGSLIAYFLSFISHISDSYNHNDVLFWSTVTELENYQRSLLILMAYFYDVYVFFSQRFANY